MTNGPFLRGNVSFPDSALGPNGLLDPGETAMAQAWIFPIFSRCSGSPIRAGQYGWSSICGHGVVTEYSNCGMGSCWCIMNPAGSWGMARIFLPYGVDGWFTTVSFQPWTGSCVPGKPGVSCSTNPPADDCDAQCRALGFDGRACRDYPLPADIGCTADALGRCCANETYLDFGVCTGGRSCCCYGTVPTPTQPPSPTPTSPPGATATPTSPAATATPTSPPGAELTCTIGPATTGDMIIEWGTETFEYLKGTIFGSNNTIRHRYEWSNTDDPGSVFQFQPPSGDPQNPKIKTTTAITCNAYWYPSQLSNIVPNIKLKVTEIDSPFRWGECTATVDVVLPCPDCPSSVLLEPVFQSGQCKYKINLSWDDVEYDEGYEIFRCIGAGCTPTTSVALVEQDDTDLVDDNNSLYFSPNSIVRYIIKPLNEDCPDLSCSVNQITCPYPTCSGVSVNAPSSIDVGDTKNISALVTGLSESTCLRDILLSDSPPNIVIITTPQGYVSPYSTTITGLAAGAGKTTTITATARLKPDANPNTCEGQADVSVNAPSWVQVEGGDVHAQDRISVQPPDNVPFSLELNTYAGIVSQGSDNPPDFSPGKVSTPGWLVIETTPSPNRGYNYFEALISSPTIWSTPPTIADLNNLSNGFYKYEGDLTLPNAAWNIGSNKRFVILVDGNLNIGKQQITVGSNSFLAFIVKENINLDPDLTVLQGVYLADGDFKTGTSGGSDQSLTIEGIVAASNINLEREYNSATTPAVKFIYRPDFWFNSPPEIWKPNVTWREQSQVLFFYYNYPRHFWMKHTGVGISTSFIEITGVIFPGA